MRAQFIRGQEPKEAMDLGFRSWANLKTGDILIPKKEVDIDGKGAFVSRGVDTIWVNMFILVLKVQKFYDPEIAKHIIHVGFFKCWDLDEAINKRNNMHDLIPSRRMFGTRAQFENRFEIFQRKDESKIG